MELNVEKIVQQDELDISDIAQRVVRVSNSMPQTEWRVMFAVALQAIKLLGTIEFILLKMYQNQVHHNGGDHGVF